ncbi:MAG: capsule assembly Wzi family protein [Bacteroidales bacterium]|nr:capsule assembly Wzi family protein [Bacteroidales bacterium]
MKPGFDTKFGPNVEPDNYYNNYIYKSGWTYYGRILGSPLLTAPYYKPYPTNTVNNILKAHAFGLSGHVSMCIHLAFQIVYLQNDGQYHNLYPKTTKQWLSALKLGYRPPTLSNWSFSLDSSVETGNEFGNNFAIVARACYSPNIRLGNKEAAD